MNLALKLLKSEQVLQGLSGSLDNATQGLTTKDIARHTRFVLSTAEQCCETADLETLSLISDRLLPYIAQRCEPNQFSRVARKASLLFREAGDDETAAIWLQFAAIRMRLAGRLQVAERLASEALRIAPLGTERNAYCTLTYASLLTRTGRTRESYYLVKRISEGVPITDSNLSLHAQADMELSKIYLRLEKGEEASYLADRSSERLNRRGRMDFGNAILQGYSSEIMALRGKHGTAFVYGLRSATALLFDNDLDTLRECGIAFHHLVSVGVYGFREEQFLAEHMTSVLLGSPAPMLLAEAKRAAAKLYLFHLEHTAPPHERYNNALEVLCLREVA